MWAELIFGFITRYWRAILIAMGLGVAGVAAYSVAKSITGAQPAIEQAISISAYVIPVMVYGMTFMFLMQMFTTMREMFKR